MSAPPKVSDEDRAFAEDVKTLLSQSLSGIPWDTTNLDVKRLDAFRVASSLAAMRRGLEGLHDRDIGGALAEAHSMLSALENGADHPIWRFLGAIRPGHRPPPSHTALMKRAIVVVISDLLRESGERAFAEKTVRRLWDAGVQVGKATLLDWRSRRTENGLDGMVSMIREALPARSEKEGTDQLTCAMAWAVECWTFLAD